jgi:hypothetical protein
MERATTASDELSQPLPQMFSTPLKLRYSVATNDECIREYEMDFLHIKLSGRMAMLQATIVDVANYQIGESSRSLCWLCASAPNRDHGTLSSLIVRLFASSQFPCLTSTVSSMSLAIFSLHSTCYNDGVLAFARTSHEVGTLNQHYPKKRCLHDHLQRFDLDQGVPVIYFHIPVML